MYKNVIYILTNPSFPEYVKIGYASDLDRRVRELNSSAAVPFAFRVYAVYETPNQLTDKELHKLIDKLNPDLRAIDTIGKKTRTKEFFAMKPEEAYLLLESIAKISGTEKHLFRIKPSKSEEDDEKSAQDIRNEAKRPPFTFDMIGAKEGEFIYYTKDPSIRAEIVDSKHVRYENETLSLTALAKKILKSNTAHIPGPSYFSYKDKTLNDLRKEKGL